MRLLIITRKIDHTDSRVGFFSQWVSMFATKVDGLIVITWQQSGEEKLSEKVRLISLTGSTFKKIVLLKSLLFSLRKEYDSAFIHMNPEYVLIAGPLLRMLGKRIGFWYTHTSITFKRRVAEMIAHQIFSASEKSFRQPLFKKKLIITGHGIVLDHFSRAYGITERPPFSLMTAGRITSTKDIETMIKAVYELHKRGIVETSLRIIGSPAVLNDSAYLLALQQMVKSMKLEHRIQFIGAVHYIDMPQEYAKAVICINLSMTESLDKVILEAFASGTLVLTSNIAVKEIIDPQFYIENNNSTLLAEAIIRTMSIVQSEQEMFKQRYYNEVKHNHSLDRLTDILLQKL